MNALTGRALALLFTAWTTIGLTSARADDVLAPSVAEHVSAGTVRVTATTSTGPLQRRVASGFRWATADLVVTAFHVVAAAENIVVESRVKGNGAAEATIVAVDKDADLALLKLASSLPGELLTTSASAAPRGAAVWVVGFPFEVNSQRSRRIRLSEVAPQLLGDALDPSAKADLNGLGFPSLALRVLQLEGDLLPGDSGAPIVDAQGNVVGVGDGGLKLGAVGLGWGIPAQHLKTLRGRPASVGPIDSARLTTVKASFFSESPRPKLDEAFWQAALQRNSLEGFREYLDQFATGGYAPVARQRVLDFERQYAKAFEYYRLALDYEGRIGFGGAVDAITDVYSQVEANLRRALSIYPRFEDAHFELGHAQYMLAGLLPKGDQLAAFRGSIEKFNDSIDLNPDLAEAYLYRGFAFSQVSEQRFACRDYFSFIRLKSVLSQRKFAKYASEGRFSRRFLEYHGCSVPKDLTFVEPDFNQEAHDCKPLWYTGEPEECAAKGVEDAMVILAEEIMTLGSSAGFLTAKETNRLEASAHWAAELVRKSNPRGYYLLGQMYWNGMGRPPLDNRARAEMKRAADAEVPAGLGSYGVMLSEGIGGDRDLGQARRALARGAVLEDASSKRELGRLDDLEDDIKRDAALRTDYLRIVARGTAIGYVFTVRNGQLVDRMEATARAGHDEMVLFTIIDQLGRQREAAATIVPVLVARYRAGSAVVQQRIRLALRSLRLGTSEAATLMADEAVRVKPQEAPDRINLNDTARVRLEALAALAAFGKGSAAVVDRISPLLSSNDRYTRLYALAVVGESGVDRSRTLIAPLASDASPMVRAEANRYLQRAPN